MPSMPVSLFGGITIATQDGESINLPTRKTALVLAVLAMLGEKGTTREALAEWIWPDRSDGQAKSSLRQALTGIRKVLPSISDGFALKTERDRVKLTGPGTPIDVRLFESLVNSNLPDDQIRAAALYAGDLLDGVQLSPSLDNLVATHRERLRQQALALVEALSELSDITDNDRGACEALANRLLSADVAAEGAHRAIIRIRLSEGQPNAARRQLERCIKSVRSELSSASSRRRERQH